VSARSRLVFVLAAAVWSLLGCSEGAVLRGRIQGLETTVLDAEKNGAMRCAPRELAIAKSQLEFATIDLDQGQLSNAQAHLAKAEPNARAAIAMSPPDRCSSREFVEIASKPGDHDADGIPDTADKCPNQPEDFDGFQDDDGCPDPDNDGDTVADVNDFCPNTPGYPGGDKPGCPRKNSTVIVTKTEIKITQQIQFEFNRAVIRPVSFKILDEVVDVLKQNPKITLEVQGHTDNIGGAVYNQGLSQKRAESVKTYLVQHGIDSSRLTSKGYGLTRPLLPNTSEANRALNRRVQFIRTEEGPAP
jgi:outer membrane protein OmpA-like peptidoglycan-associated protein